MANLPTNTTLSPKINQVEKKIPNITNLATTSAFTTIENDVRDHSKNITTPEFNKLTAETFTATNGETKIQQLMVILLVSKKDRF